MQLAGAGGGGEVGGGGGARVQLEIPEAQLEQLVSDLAVAFVDPRVRFE